MEIRVNVYDLHEQNEMLYPFGLGLYHSGVEVNGLEYTFGSGSGIFNHPSKQAPNVKFRESILVGIFRGTTRDFDRVIDSLRNDFSGTKYHLLERNCNSFAEMLVFRLLNVQIPGWINRMAFYGSLVSCVLPQNLTGAAAPVDNTTSTGSSTFGGVYNSSSSSQTRSAAPASWSQNGKPRTLGGN